MLPYKIIFNHDTTNIVTCESPYHKKGEGFTEEMLRASIDELSGIGVDAVTLCPGNGSVPWWQSKVYPDHYKWFRERTGKEPNSYGKYIENGGDIVKVFSEQCRKNGIAPILSLRLKDEHQIENLDHENISKFFYEHQSWRISRHLDAPMGWRGLNWIIPEVRKERLMLIEELANNYDLDGFELDFMRFPPFFKLEETCYGQRERVMTSFVSEVRQILNNTGKNMCLILRVPHRFEEYKDLGIDLTYLSENNLIDGVNVSPSYVTTVESDIEIIKNLAPKASVYFELTHCAMRGPSPTWGALGDDYPVRMCTREQLYTAANLAYKRGADGISLFNFVYYRPYGKGSIDSSFCEPPFDVCKNLRDKEKLNDLNQHYWLPFNWQTGLKTMKKQFPKWFVKNDEEEIFFDIALPQKEIKKARIRIAEAGSAPILSALEPMANMRGAYGLEWKAYLNGNELSKTDDVSDPYEIVGGGFEFDANQYKAFSVEPDYIKEGLNVLKVKLIGAPIHENFKVALIYADLDIKTEE